MLCAELCLRVFYFHYRFLFDLIIFVLLALLGFSENTHLLYLFHFFHCKYCLIFFISRLLSTFVRRFFFSFLKQNFSKLSQFLPIVSLWLIECFLFVVRCNRSVITNPAKPCKWAEKRSVNKKICLRFVIGAFALFCLTSRDKVFVMFIKIIRNISRKVKRATDSFQNAH